MFAIEFIFDHRCEDHDEPLWGRFRIIVGAQGIMAYARLDDPLGGSEWIRVIGDGIHRNGRRYIGPLAESRIIALAFQRYHELASPGGVPVVGEPIGISLNKTPIFDLGTIKREE